MLTDREGARSTRRSSRNCACAVVSKRFSLLRGHHEQLGLVEPFWEAQLAVLVTIALYVALPARLTVGPRWLVPSLEGVLLFGLVISTPYLHHTQAPARRRITIGLIAVVTAANFTAEGLLLHYLLQGGGRGGRTLVFSAAQIWLTNVAVFGLWFWEVDRGVRTGGPRPNLANRTSSFPKWTPNNGRCETGDSRSWTTSTSRSPTPAHLALPIPCP
jgi:hypothetical protein